MPAFTTYQQFLIPEEAEPYLSILKEHEIPFEFFKSRKQLDTFVVGEALDDPYELKIPAHRFEEANNLLLGQLKVDLTTLSPDFYLFSFTDDELKEILQQPDAWSKQDYLLAREILAGRGINITDEQLHQWKRERMHTLATPEKQGRGWVIAGYFFAVLGGFFGMLIGLSLWQSMKTLPDGRRVPIYDQATRRRGKSIFLVALVIFVFSLLSRLGNAYMRWLDIFTVFMPAQLGVRWPVNGYFAITEGCFPAMILCQ